MPVLRKQLFTKSGRPIRALENALEFHSCKTLEELQDKIANGNAYQEVIMRLRGCGNLRSPGLLPQFLFNLKSRAEQKQDQVALNAGDGI